MKLPSPPGKFLYIPVKITWKTEKKDSFLDTRQEVFFLALMQQNKGMCMWCVIDASSPFIIPVQPQRSFLAQTSMPCIRNQSCVEHSQITFLTNN